MILFLLYLLHYLRLSFFLEIDFSLIGLIFSAYFLDYYSLFSISWLILLLNYFFTKNFLFFTGGMYLALPLLAKKISSIFNLSFFRFVLLACLFLVIYIGLRLLLLNIFGFKNFIYILFKNLGTLILIGLIFGYALIFEKN